MIIDSNTNFNSNIGVNPNSIDLQNDWTTPINATNIEANGATFAKESDFGSSLNGMSGLGSLQDIFNGVGISNLIPNPMEWDWHEWLLAAGGGYTLYKVLFSDTGKKRRAQSKLEREIYKNQLGEVKKKYKARKKTVRDSYPLLAF